nr:MAG TPA: glycoside hydrolase family protein [Caudoviricetes sp.]
MTMYHLQCLLPYFIWCAIGAGAFIYGFLKGWWSL